MENDTPPPAIGTSPGGFASSFLKRQKKPSLSPALPQPLAPLASSQHIPSGTTAFQGDSLLDKSLPTTVVASHPPPPLHAPFQEIVPGPRRSGPKAQAGRLDSPKYLETLDETVPFLPRDLDRFPRGQSPYIPFPIDTTNTAFDFNHGSDGYIPNGTPIHSRLASEPIIPLLRSPPPLEHKRSETMALQPPLSKPPPLRIDANLPRMPSTTVDPKQPKTPGNKITSFFGWKTTTSPGAESSSTEISDAGRSPLPSPLPQQPFQSSPYAARAMPVTAESPGMTSMPVPVRMGSLSGPSADSGSDTKVAELEKELREISSELAGSIRREMELEDLVERLQLESNSDANRRTSDYFSDSGTSSVKTAPESGKYEDIERIRRAAEQERALLKAELSQKLQDERTKRTASESHVQILENQVQQFRRNKVDNSNLSSKTKELEIALEDTRRKLIEERQLKDNFEDLLTAMRVELEQLRNERDQLRDGQKGRFNSIAEEDDGSFKRGSMIGLTRSSSLARKPMRSSMSHGGLSRSNSVSAKDRETRESLADRVKDVEAQRDALHKALKNLLDRQAYQARENEKRIRILEYELAQAQQVGSPRKLGYEREVRNLREEVNHLRRRADDALEQKWLCENGLTGLKMDLDRAEQETGSLRSLLEEHDITVPEHLASVQSTSSSLESAYKQLQSDMANSPKSPQDEQELQMLARQVQQQLDVNNTLQLRLAEAIKKGDREQKASASSIYEMQNKLKLLEDTLMVAQHHSEEEMAKHEEEIRVLKENHNAQLLRAKNGIKSPVMLSPKPPSSPFTSARSPRLDKTTSGDGIPLSQAVQTEQLEARVKELEKALRAADLEMGEVVGRMNAAQIEVAELQSDRDEALRQSRRLEAEIQAQRQKIKALMG